MEILKKLGKKKLFIFSMSILLVVTLVVAGIMSRGAKSQVQTNGIRIYLSPSNQSSNYYAGGNTTELEQCDKIAAATAKQLEKLGYSVMVGQSGDTMQNRCKESDAFGADMHIPIHTNAYDGEYVGGTRVYVMSSVEAEAAQSVLDTLGLISPGENDAVDYKPELYEIYTPLAQTIYVECEFHDTTTGANWICNNTDSIAKAIADGVNNYYSNMEK